jgi:hypothetical protein
MVVKADCSKERSRDEEAYQSGTSVIANVLRPAEQREELRNSERLFGCFGEVCGGRVVVWLFEITENAVRCLIHSGHALDVTKDLLVDLSELVHPRHISVVPITVQRRILEVGNARNKRTDKTIYVQIGFVESNCRKNDRVSNLRCQGYGTVGGVRSEGESHKGDLARLADAPRVLAVTNEASQTLENGNCGVDLRVVAGDPAK